MSSIKQIRIHPSLLNTLQKVYSIRNKIFNNIVKSSQEISPLFNNVNFYQDGKGLSVLSKMDELFNLHSSYNKFPNQYQLLNTSLHDSSYICTRDLLYNLKSEITNMISCLENKKSEAGDKQRVTRGLKIDMKISDFYGNYITNLKSYIPEIDFISTKLEDLPINSTFESKQLKIDLSLDGKVYDEIKKEFNFTNKYESGNRIEKITCLKELIEASAYCGTLATFLMKFANDIRFLSSGPRSGLGEMTIPENEPGSSIMPGKVNPTQCESLTMICAQVLGNNNAVNIAGSANMFEGSNFLPLISNNTIRSIVLLTDGLKSFRKNCMEGADFIDVSIQKEIEKFKI